LPTKKNAIAQQAQTKKKADELAEAVSQIESDIFEARESGMFAHRDAQHQVRIKAGELLLALVLQSAIAQECGLEDCIKACESVEISFSGLSDAVDYLASCVESSLPRNIPIGAVACEVAKMIRHYDFMTLKECLRAAWGLCDRG